MKKNWMAVFCFTLLFLLSAVTQTMATTIVYTPTNNGSDNYTLNFTVTNNTLAKSIEWLSIYFGVTTDGLNFDNDHDQLLNFSKFVPDDHGVVSPAGWLSSSFEPTPIDRPGEFDSEVIGVASIAPGDSLSGFSVTFDMAATESYDHLWFDVGNFDVTSGGYVWLGSGYTQAAGGPPAVPEPATVVLFLLGLATLGLAKKKKFERD